MIFIGDVMNKSKKKAIILAIVCLIILVGAIVAESVLGKSYFINLDYEDVMKKIDNKENFVLVLSQTTCNHCASYKPKIEEVANEYKINIYYMEVDLLSDDEKKEFVSHVSFSSTPSTVFISNGIEKTAANRINGDASKDKIIKKLKSNGFIN